MDKKLKEIYVFIDTMIFLHYKSIEEINLPKVFNAEKVVVVIPRITIRELDKAKNIHAQKRIRDRAKQVLSKIEKWTLDEQYIRPGVVVRSYNSVPQISAEEHGLNLDWNDDYLLATILQYKKDNPTDVIFLLSQDSGPRLTARHLNIPAIELPNEYKLPIVVDPVESENIKLKTELTKLQSALPKLIVCFSSSEPPVAYTKFLLKKPQELIEKEVEIKLDEIRIKFPKHYPPALPQISKEIASALGMLDFQAKEFDRYNKEVDQYVQAYRSYLEKLWEYKKISGRTIQFQIEVRNIGTAPADDVDMFFHFPDGFKLTEKSPSPPKEPKLPVEPRTMQQMLQDGMYLNSNFGNMAALKPFPLSNMEPPRSFTLRKTKSYELKDHERRIKHGGHSLLPELFLTFNSFETAASFSCEYKIQPANLPEPLEGNLSFITEREGD